jgi:hypothetical protein
MVNNSTIISKMNNYFNEHKQEPRHTMVEIHVGNGTQHVAGLNLLKGP